MSTASRGTWAEKEVKEFLEEWEAGSVYREFNRLTDSKAAGRIIKAAAADFEYFTDEYLKHIHGLIEVKETEHTYRLARDKVSQLPRLRKREKCGGTSYVVVYHSVSKLWRAMSVKYLTTTGDKGSWNLTDLPCYGTCGLALKAINPEVFL